MTIVLAILAFGFFIFSHELGHFVTARLFKVGVNEFAVGFGPKILSRVSKKTSIRYSLRLIPFGGFVSMEGEDEESEKENSFSKKPIWQRIIITAAGASVNLISGFLFMAVVVLLMPRLGSTVVASFGENAASAGQGLKVDDEIVAVNGTSVDTSFALFYEISRCSDGKADLTVVRDGERTVIEGITFPTSTEKGVTVADGDFLVYGLEKNVGNVVKYTFSQSFTAMKMIWESLFDLISGKYGIEAVSGPVGTTEVMSSAAKSGPSSFLMICSVIAMNIGIFNLLPFPALDGGRIMLLIIEKITKKKVPKKIETAINFAGLVVLFGFMIIVTFKDLFSFFS